MALTINTNIKNDADGYLLDASAVKVEEGKMLPEALGEKADKTVEEWEFTLADGTTVTKKVVVAE